MWGLGGNHYWARKEKGKVEGIVVVFAWMSSEEKHLKNYVDMYSALGWNSIVCRSQFLNLYVSVSFLFFFFPRRFSIWTFDRVYWNSLLMLDRTVLSGWIFIFFGVLAA